MLVTTEYFDQQLVLDATNPQNPGESSSGGQALGILYRTRMILFTNNIVPGKTTPLSALTQPTYTGYASQQITWNPPNRDPLLGICTEGGLLLWQMANAANPTTVYGYGLVDPSGTILYATEVFPGGPVPLVDALSALNVVPQWVANNASPGQVTVIK